MPDICTVMSFEITTEPEYDYYVFDGGQWRLTTLSEYWRYRSAAESWMLRWWYWNTKVAAIKRKAG